MNIKASNRPFIIGIGGGTASGKTTLAQKLKKSILLSLTLSQDNYYNNHEHLSLKDRSNLNFDHPDAIDFLLLKKHLCQLCWGKDIQIPQYDFSQHRRLEKSETVKAGRYTYIIVEGTLIFSQIRGLDFKIFVDTDSDIRLIRRLKRDIQERGRTTASIIQQYLNTTRPMHCRFVEPTKNQADIVIPGAAPSNDQFKRLVKKIKDTEKKL